MKNTFRNPVFYVKEGCAFAKAMMTIWWVPVVSVITPILCCGIAIKVFCEDCFDLFYSMCDNTITTDKTNGTAIANEVVIALIGQDIEMQDQSL